MELVVMSIQKTNDSTVIQVKPPIPISGFKSFCGIDPGTRNLGMAVYNAPLNALHLYQITLTRYTDPVLRIQDAAERLKSIISTMNEVAIEGAAFGFAVGAREELGEQRAAFVLTALNANKAVKIIAPNTIRKTVFGDGRTKAHEFWTLPKDVGKMQDALAALSCLYYSVAGAGR